MLRIGIPRGLLYYKYYPFWKTFFTELGHEVVVSPPTNRVLLSTGLSLAESEICLPVKSYYGHVAALLEKCDLCFVPRIVAVENDAYTCPKFLGLPDMIRAAFPDLPLATIEINLKKGFKGYYFSFYRLARRLGAKAAQAARAIYRAERELVTFHHRLHAGSGIDEALAKALTPEKERPDVTIGIAGHAYNVYDRYLSVDLVKKLRERGARVLTPENVPPATWERYTKRLPKYLFWTYEKELLGASLYWMEKRIVDGIIYVLSFACGPDSIVQYVLEDEARSFNIPIMPLVLDEHAAEAGIITRLEAFLDMLRRKKQ